MTPTTSAPPARGGRSAVAGEQEERPPFLVLPTSRCPLDVALPARLFGRDMRPDGLPLLLGLDAVEPVELIATPVEENEWRAGLDQEVGVLPLGPSGASGVPTRVRPEKPAAFDLAPLLVAQVRWHSLILGHPAAVSRTLPRPSSPRWGLVSPVLSGRLRQMVVVRVAWTLADLAGVAVPGPDEVAEALGMRLQRSAA